MKIQSMLSGVRPYVAGALLAVAASVAVTAVAHGDGPRGERGTGHGPAAMGMMASPEHMQRMVDRMLRGVDASDEQRTKIKSIAESLANDLAPQRDEMRKSRAQMLELLKQPEVDASAVEAARQTMLQRHDATSQRISKALVEAAQVLTPEQRIRLADRLESGPRHGERGEHGRPGHREPRPTPPEAPKS